MWGGQGEHSACLVRASWEKLGLFSLTKWKLRWDLIAIYKYIMRVNTREGGEQFKPKDNVGTGTNGSKQAMDNFWLCNRAKFLSIGRWRLWSSQRGWVGVKSFWDKVLTWHRDMHQLWAGPANSNHHFPPSAYPFSVSSRWRDLPLSLTTLSAQSPVLHTAVFHWESVVFRCEACLVWVGIVLSFMYSL